jgi:DNA polymerase-3 subunit delta'
VFVVGDAELMVPQESSPEAANAFLKLLEEPPPSTTIVLTSSQPGALLPTIRSRVLALRVPPLLDENIAALLSSEGLTDGTEALRIARKARGSLTRAIRLAAAKDQPDPERVAGKQLLLAALGTGAIARIAAASERRPAGARNELVSELDSFADWLRDLAAVAAGSSSHVADAATVPILERAVKQRDVTVEGTLRAIDRVGTARELAQGNVNPQLIVADLLRRVQRDLSGDGNDV